MYWWVYPYKLSWTNLFCMENNFIYSLFVFHYKWHFTSLRMVTTLISTDIAPDFYLVFSWFVSYLKIVLCKYFSGFSTHLWPLKNCPDKTISYMIQNYDYFFTFFVAQSMIWIKVSQWDLDCNLVNIFKIVFKHTLVGM